MTSIGPPIEEVASELTTLLSVFAREPLCLLARAESGIYRSLNGLIIRLPRISQSPSPHGRASIPPN